MERKQQQALNEAIQRVVLGEATQAAVEKTLKQAMKMVDDAKKRLQKIAKKYDQDRGIFATKKWKSQKNRIQGTDLHSAKTFIDLTGWMIESWVDEDDIMLSWENHLGDGEGDMDTFSHEVESWEAQVSRDMKDDYKNKDSGWESDWLQSL